MPRPDLNSEDYYKVLGCERNADAAALKKAYRKLAVKWHPDKNPDNADATTNFQKISEAYAVLSDDQKRKMYDQYGKEGANAAENMGDNMPSGGFPGFHGGTPGGGGMHHMSPEEAQALFGNMFGNADPFGGAGMFGSAMGGSRRGGGGMDPISMMFGGMPMGGSGMGGMPNINISGMPMGGMNMGGMGGMPNMGGMGGMPNMGGMNMGSGRQGQTRYDAIPPRTVVSLKGLVNASDRNGDQGVIQDYDPVKGRYVVALEDSDQTMSIKPQNILQHVHVTIHDVQSQPELNGKNGTIMTWIPSKERYNIHVSAMQKVVSLRPANVVLKTGTVGRISGLKSKPELNGKWGTIKAWVQESNKYDIQLSQQQAIRIKVENLRV